MIAILAWGSLIWKPQDLPYEGSWKLGGPVLPLEFTRVKTARALTLVLDPTNGVDCPTQFAMSSRTHLADAIADLQEREGAKPEEVGYVDLQHDLSSIQVHPDQINVDRTVRQWCHKEGVKAAIWTAIPPNFTEELGVEFSVDAVVDYLKQLSKEEQDSVLEYMQNTPTEITTPSRQRVESIWAI